jgi:predicted RNase H-like nuclease
MFAGVDACKGGWVVAKSRNWPCREVPVLTICADFRSVIELTADCKRVAVDISIGLTSGKQIRKCDLEAKRMLSGHNTSALFYAPPRETLHAETPQEFQKLHRKARSVGAGLPVWGFLPKVIEANRAMTRELQKRIVEFHPELTWLRLAGENLETKHSLEGIADRKRVMRKFVPELERILRWKDYLGRAAAIDDLLDALAGIGVAKDSLRGTPCRLPDKAEEIDRTGLRMEIWY